MFIKTTPDTISEIKSIIEQNPEEGKAVRVYLAGMGWSGPSWGLALDEQKDGDEVYTEDGLTFLMEKDLNVQFGEMTVEYTDHGYIVQPSTVAESDGCSSCSGCGH